MPAKRKTSLAGAKCCCRLQQSSKPSRKVVGHGGGEGGGGGGGSGGGHEGDASSLRQLGRTTEHQKRPQTHTNKRTHTHTRMHAHTHTCMRTESLYTKEALADACRCSSAGGRGRFFLLLLLLLVLRCCERFRMEMAPGRSLVVCSCVWVARIRFPLGMEQEGHKQAIEGWKGVPGSTYQFFLLKLAVLRARKG